MNEYFIELKEGCTFSEVTSLEVYLVPKDVKINKDSLFRINLGYIDLRGENHLFKCIDSSRMTLEVMHSIIASWSQWDIDRDKD